MDRLHNIINTVRSNKGLSSVFELSSNQDLRLDIGFDSLDLAELTVRIEKEYGIDIYKTGYVLTVGDIMKKLSC
jgi:acyl carrier protein